MFQQRKKDFLQRIIEEFFSKFQELLNSRVSVEYSEKKNLLNDAFNFFFETFDVKQSDSTEMVIRKIEDTDLLQQYARLLKVKYEFVDIKEPEQLQKAFDIIKYLEAADNTYSWDRTILREDLLRLLDENDIN